MRPIHRHTAYEGGDLIVFDYYDGVLGGGHDDVIVAAISVTDGAGTARAYARLWQKHRWSVPTRANFEAKFLDDPIYRETYRVKE